MRCVRPSLIAVTLTAAACLAACQVVGPESVRVGRSRYNEAIHQTDKQQMLQNLVRLRYTDFPYFLEVTSILSAPSFQASIAGAATVGDPFDFYEIGGGLSYAETPVIVYSPLGGESFTRRLLQPLDFKTVSLLTNAGWNSERVMRLCVQSINGVQNAESAGGPTPADAPDFEVFNRVIATLERLHGENLEQFGAINRDVNETRMWIDPAARQRPDVQQFYKDLSLDPEVESYRVVSALRGGGDTIAILMRPLLSVMYYMSQAVEPPSSDIRDGLVSVTVDEDGEPFDWQEVMRGMIRIRSSAIQPRNAFVSVRYGGSYFYIARVDAESKESFTLLFVLFTLNAGEKPTGAPLLSLPIG